MVLTSTPVADLIYWHEIEALFISWTSKPDLISFKKVYNQALNFVYRHRNIRLFCLDQTQSEAFGQEHEAWLNSEFSEQINQLLEEAIYVAVVLSERHFHAVVNNYQLHTTSPPQRFIRLNYFTALEEARQWLEAIKEGRDMILS